MRATAAPILVLHANREQITSHHVVLSFEMHGSELRGAGQARSTVAWCITLAISSSPSPSWKPSRLVGIVGQVPSN